jgi:hypothetical protein
MIKNITLIILLVALSGCATIFSSADQKLSVTISDTDGNPVDDHGCKVYPTNGSSYPLVGNPAVITVSKSSGGLNFVCSKKGYKQTNQASVTGFNPVTLVNILFWPGFIVDGITGAYKTHPSNVFIQMQKN